MIKKNDLVRLRNGHASIRVTKVTRWTFCGEYLKSSYEIIDRPLADAVPLHQHHYEEPMTSLYELPDGRYCTQIATDSQGRAVVEIRGTNEIIPVDPQNLKEVLPFTIEVHFFDGGNHHFEVAPDIFQKGDVVLVGKNFGEVSAVDTKCRRPRQAGSTLRKLAFVA